MPLALKVSCVCIFVLVKAGCQTATR